MSSKLQQGRIYRRFSEAVGSLVPTLPRPEDVPAGEEWTAKCAGLEGEWIGTRSSNPDRNYPWILTNPQTQEREVVRDSKVTLISRLVPERKENA